MSKKSSLNNNSIKDKRKKVKQLQSKIESASQEIDQLADQYNDVRMDSNKDAEKFFNKFHLETLSDSLNFEKGIKKEYPIEFFVKRTKWRKLRDKKIDDYADLISQQYDLKIDIALEKISLLQEKLTKV